ncbi:MAG: hypothetical protein NWE94_09215 [Candidatus Bathyarchaeota archaeon]|nr:hypothetical protein [Candidatus Bathyarchaeota archaeon]
MSKKPQSKDEALEALDFIVNVLKEHEKDLDRLITELGTVAGQLGDTGELSSRVEKIEQKISSLQGEIADLVNCLSVSPREAPVALSTPRSEPVSAARGEAVSPVVMQGPPVILRCKQWEDFQNLAFQAQTLSFIYKDAEKTFQADALKGNQIVTFSGELPKLTALLRMWLSKQLDVSEKRVLEGILAIG